MPAACRWSFVLALVVVLVGSLSIGAGSGLADEGHATPAPEVAPHGMPTMPPHPAFIHRGACGDVAAVAYPLAPVAIGMPLVPTDPAEGHDQGHAGEHGDGTPVVAVAVGAAAAVPGETSVTVVRATLPDLLATDYAITVVWSEHDVDFSVACGALGGVVTGGDLVVGLHEVNDSGAVGFAWLRDNGEGTTTVTIFLAPGLFVRGHDDEAVPAGGPVAPGESVAVTLTEFGVQLSTTTLRVGVPYTFEVTNAGTVAHEFVIERSGAVHEPLRRGGAEAMLHEIPPGQTATLTWTFAEPGTYQLACHQPGHYEAGQVLVIEVVG